MSRDIYEHANDHFFNSGVGYEYGRPDMQTWNKVGNRTTDSSRNEQDNDHEERAVLPEASPAHRVHGGVAQRSRSVTWITFA